MKADGSLKSLLQGVSQQPIRDRLPGQCTEQINMSADPVRGLSRRPGTDLVGSLGTAPALGWSTTKTKDGRQFLAKVTATGPEVYTYNAEPMPVNVTGGMDYWTTAGNWSVGAYKDDVYFANSGVPVAMRGEVASYWNAGPNRPPAGLIQILGGAYGKTYTLSLDGVLVAQFATVNGSEASHGSEIGTTLLARILEWLLLNNTTTTSTPSWFPDGLNVYYDGAGAFASGWTVTRVEDIIHIAKNAPGPEFSLTMSDDMGNVNAKALTDSVPDVADLPRLAPHNFVVRVAQETNPDEDMWLRFVSDDPAATDGSHFGVAGAWYETTAPNLRLGFNKDTMPRKMTYNTGTQAFSVGVGDWADRSIGTDITNPEPSFVGYGIADVTTFQSRLVFIAGETVVASRSKKPDNFWIGSASALVDSDPLDLTSQAAFSTALRWAVPHNKDLIIFSADGQFVMFGRQAVTPTNAALVLTTSFEADMSAKPSPSGRNVFFATRYGRFTGVREFYTEGGTDINDTRPITQHVNKYIRGQAAHLSSTSNYDTLLVHTNTDRHIVYPYQFIWSDQQKVQSAWHKWEFQHDIVYSFFEDDLIYLVTIINGEYFLLRMSLDVTDEEGVGYPLHTDMRFDVDGVNTQFVLPFDWLKDENLVVVQSDGSPNPGLAVGITSIEYSEVELGYVVTLKTNMQGGNIVVGVLNHAEYQPTVPRLKDQSGDVIGNARLMINQFLVSLESTGNIVGQKLTPWGNGPEINFEGYVVNEVSTIVGMPGISDGVFQMPFKERAERASIRLYTESHLPMTILDIEWEGTVNKRGKRISTGE